MRAHLWRQWSMIGVAVLSLAGCTHTAHRTPKTHLQTDAPSQPAGETEASSSILKAKQLQAIQLIYDATDDMLNYCAQVPAKQYAQHQKVVKDFWRTYPKQHQLYLSSPYYAELKEHLNSKPNSLEYTPEIYQKECKHYQDALNLWLKDTQDVERYFSVLKQQQP